MGWMWIVWVAVLIALVYFITRIVQGSGSKGGGGGQTAEDILKQRFARGEITKEEYEEKLRDLRK